MRLVKKPADIPACLKQRMKKLEEEVL